MAFRWKACSGICAWTGIGSDAAGEDEEGLGMAWIVRATGACLAAVQPLRALGTIIAGVRLGLWVKCALAMAWWF